MLKYSLIFWALTFLKLNSYSQSNVHNNSERLSQTSINWNNGLTWNDILQKAKIENKPIFVDAYATWCGPCKKMDTMVYSNYQVEKSINENFIAFKVQMDSSKLDSKEVKDLYSTVKSLKEQYHIGGLPSYLFFSPFGVIIHREIGLKSVDEFLTLLSDALKPSRQFYTLLQQYHEGNKSYPKIPYLVDLASRMDDENTAHALADDYIDNFLIKLPRFELFKKDNLDFISTNTKSSKEKGFKLIYDNPRSVDSLVTWRTEFLDFIITNDDLAYLFDQKSLVTKPNWTIAKQHLKSKYGVKNAERIIIDSKIKWYSNKKDWHSYVNACIEKIAKYGEKASAPFGKKDWALNWYAWELFLHTDSKAKLSKALEWSNKSIKLTSPKTNVQYYDTNANLRYKLGRKKEAIKIEQKAFNLDHDATGVLANLQKMKKGLSTWN